MMGDLENVNGQVIDEYKKEINEIFERCCRFITAHSSPKEVQNSPTLDDVKSDFKHWQEIKAKFF